ncbi:MAG: TonB-dependent receptor plug domain-containing protein, partial [Woeseiaceae bacterium]
MIRDKLPQLAAVTAVVLALPAAAHEGNTEAIEELVVYGRAEPQVGIATSASAGFIGYDDIKLPPLLRAGELVEAVPGMVATQHSGTGKANQYFLRGFNLDHGTDFSASAEGVPLNMRTHGHGQGYLDLNFLIPELVASTTFRKGPYTARAGDFSSAGSVEFNFYERLEDTLLGGTIGGDDYYRALAAGSLDAPGGVVTAALDVDAYAGPWLLDEDLSQQRIFASYAFDAAGVPAKITFQGYDADWNSTDQIPQRAVEAGLIDQFGFVDPDLGGQTERYLLTGSLDFGAWQVSGYALDYDFTLFSNFTYFLDDPVMGDEFEQRDRRRVYGAEV